MEDIFGNKLFVGDEVATLIKDYRGLQIAEISAFTAKNVRVEYTDKYNRPRTYLCPPTWVVKRV